ncbi:MAG: phosphoglucomutase/phosphomannomutase family protein [Candidatus Aminicenantes bacterium]|nr:MAG: phosphoglucomutase/phosphomannomutase family protein [Candidatus Aminicenantes bacterium]
MIKFGTSGWRAVMGEEFTFQNVRIVVQAIANHLKRKFPRGQISVIVNYDTRFLSERYAFEAAKILSNDKIHVYLSDRDAPSQAQAFQLIKRGAKGGINFTASFNPPEYNGLKFNTETGAPALPEETDRIEEEINSLSRAYSFTPLYPKTDFIEKIDLQKDYLSFLQQKIDWGLIRKSKIKIAVDLLYGTSREYLDEILEENHIPVEEIHGYIDPYFGGFTPSCTEDSLRELKRLVKEKNCHMGIATDADGDRFGIVDEKGNFVIQNLILSLLLEYLVSKKNWRGGVARSVATTHLIDRIAREYELPLFKTPVGFKYLADLFLKGKIIFGGEESACIAIKGHLPEKDGIFAGLLVAEMMAALGKSLSEQLKDLFRKYGKKVGKQANIPLTPARKKRLKKMTKSPPSKLNSKKVLQIETIDGIKLDFSDDDWILFRHSGTEPIIRCYAEASTKKEVERLMNFGLEKIF